MAAWSPKGTRQSIRHVVQLEILYSLTALIWVILLTFSLYPRLPDLLPFVSDSVLSSSAKGYPAISAAFHQLFWWAVAAARLLKNFWWPGLKDLVPVGILMILALSTGSFVLRPLLPSKTPRVELLLVRVGLGLGTLAYALLATGLVGLFNWAIVLALFLTWAVIIRDSIRESLGELADLGRDLLNHVTNIRPSFTALIAAVILFFSFIALVGALAPEIEFDALWYHLYLPKLFIKLGRIVDVPEEYVAQYPLTVELIYGLGLMFRNEIVAKLIHFSFGILSALISYRLASSIASRSSALVAAAIFLSTPTILWEMTTAYVDLAETFFISLSVLALLNWTIKTDRRWLLISAIAMGLALASKHLAFLALASLCTWILVQRAKSPGDTSARSGHTFNLTWPSASSLRNATLYSTIAVGIPSPWYIRSWLDTGNPVFPMFYRWFSTPDWRWNERVERGGKLFLSQFGPGHDPLAWLSFPWDLTVYPWHYAGELGLVFLGLAPFAILIIPKAKGPAIFLIYFCITYTILWASPVSSFQMRHLIPVVPALSALVAISLDRLSERSVPIAGHYTNRILRFWLVVILLSNLPWLVDFHGYRDKFWENYIVSVVHTVPFGVLSDAETREDYLARNVAGFQAVQYANHTLSADARILSFIGGLNYYSANKIVAYDLPSIPVDVFWQESPDDEALSQSLRSFGITHILFLKKMWHNSMSDYAILRQSFLDSKVTYIYEDNEALLYELRGPPGELMQLSDTKPYSWLRPISK